MSSRIWLPRLSTVLVLALFTLLYALQPGGVRPLEVFSDVVTLLAAALAAAFAFVAMARFDGRSLQRHAWLLLGIGMTLWTLAELLWTYYEVGLGDDVPYPSPADAFWAVGYAPLILGILVGHRGLGVRLAWGRRILVVVAYAVLLSALTAWFLRPMFAAAVAASWAESFLGTLYLVGDLTLAFIASLSLIVVWDGLIGRPWLPIALGMLLFAISDGAFAYADWAGIYAVGANWESAVIDLVYLAAYLLLALGAYRQATMHLDDAHPRPSEA